MSNLRALVRSSYGKYALTVFLAVFYIFIAAPLEDWFGPASSALITIPIMLASWFFGVWAGLIFVALEIVQDLLLHAAFGYPGQSIFLSQAGILPFFAMVAICLAVSYLRKTRDDLRLELAGRQETEAKLQERERFIEKILATTPFLIYIYDLRERRPVYVAGGSLQDLGYTPAQILAWGTQILNQIVHEEDRSRLIEQFRYTAQTDKGEITAISYRCKSISGEWRTLFDRQTVFARAPDGRVSQILGTIQDITDRVEMQDLIQAERDLFRAIIDNIPDQIAVRDAHGRYILTNHTLDRHGQIIPHEQVIGRTLHDLFPGDDARLYLAEDRKVIETGQRLLNMERVIERNGFKRWFLSTKVPLRDQTMKVKRVLVLSREITDLKQAEFAHLESEKENIAFQTERELTDLKARFITHMSHEIRTPLSILNSSAYLLQKHSERLAPERREELLESIQAQVILLRNVLDGVSAVMGDEDTLFGFKPTRADLAQICRVAIEDVCGSHPRAIEFTTNGTLEAVMLDANMVAYILKTFLLNAILYSAPETPIFAEARRVKDAVTVIVTDQGIGIPTRDQPRIFEAFHRGSNVGVIRGTGVSLWIAQNYAQLHGGSINFATTENEGSVFTLMLPA
jgi:PAS domain S-box-containing protein